MTTFRIDGLAELMATLRDLPKHLLAPVCQIVTTHGKAAEQEMRVHYARGYTNNLVEGLSVKVTKNPFGCEAVVRNRSPHARWAEKGTQVRHYQGQNRGSMPARPVFGRAMAAHRRAAYREIKDLLVAHGLVVTGG